MTAVGKKTRRAACNLIWMMIAALLAVGLAPVLSLAEDAGDSAAAPEETVALEAATAADSFTRCGTCEWIVVDGELLVRPVDGADEGTLDTWWSGAPWADRASEIESARFIGTVHARTCASMFEDCLNLTAVNLTGLDTKSADTMLSMFWGCKSLAYLDLSGLDTSSVTGMYGMFYDCESLTSLDLSSFDTSNVTDMGCMFNGCRSLASLNISSLNTSSVTSMWSMFHSCESLTSLDLSNFDTSKVTIMAGMFAGCSSLTSLDVSPLDTSSVTNMGAMFSYCESLTSLDVSPLDTSSVTKMGSMFHRCSSLTSLDVSPLDTSSVTDMDGMFHLCSSLTSLDLSNLDTSKVTSMCDMFNDCSSLARLDLSGFKTSSLTDMERMFSGCSSLTSLDLSSFDTSNVTDMENMFAGCSSLTSLDLSNCDTSGVTSRMRMFANCSSLESITVNNHSHLTVFPSGPDNKGWWSTTDKRWCTPEDIISTRCGVADTYITNGPAIPSIADATIAAIPAKTYTGSPIKPPLTVTLGGKTLECPLNYKVTYTNNVNAGTATATVTGIAGYEGTKSVSFTIKKAAQTITALNKFVRLKKTVSLGAKTSGAGKLTYKSSNAAVATVSAKGVVTGKKVGITKITITAAATTNWNEATKTITVKVGKANTLVAKAKKASVTASFSTLKSKAVTLASNVTVSKAKGAVSYANASTNAIAKKFKVVARTGKVTVPKGVKKGTYVIKVKVTAKGDSKFLPGTKTVTYKVVVK